MKGEAYWISPSGEIKREPISHIQDIINNPRKFGFNRGDVAEIYKRFGEKIGTEGRAREHIILRLLTLGWIRIREYPNMYWSVNLERLGRREKDRLASWAALMIRKNKDRYMPVKIGIRRGGLKQYDLEEIAKDVLYNESKRHARRRYTIMEVIDFSEGTMQIMTEHYFLVGDRKKPFPVFVVEEMESVLQKVDERNVILLETEKY